MAEEFRLRSTALRTNMIKAVIFDMDGVLIDTEKYYIQLGMDITKEMGYEIPREVFLSMRSLNRKFSKPMLLEKYGADFDFEYFHAERRRRLREILENRGIEKKPGVDEVLAVLKREGLQTAVATATDIERASSYLSQIGVLEKFDRILSVSNVKNGKPMPDLYLEAGRTLEKEPSKCIAVEDSPIGVRSAHAAGLKVIMVPDLTQPEEEIMPLLSGVAQSLPEVAEYAKIL